ncbi:MAG: putative ATP-dependent helicase [Ilumatobacteraceae bacterium]|nr:putative ATP-dependent helicase [Ilumatobacteraceae bacterium]
MAISCVYCGGQHERAVEVRECWERSGGQEVPAREEPQQLGFADAITPVRRARAATPTAGGGVRLGDLADRADPVDAPVARSAARVRPADAAVVPGAVRGPTLLGRNVVVATGSPAPAAWCDADRIVVTIDDVRQPANIVRRLRDAALARQGLVLELGGDARRELDEGAAERTERPTHALGPRFTFERQLLHHLTWSNSVTADGERSSWALRDDAIALGAQPCDVDRRGPRDDSGDSGDADDDGDSADCGDIVLPDGRVAWIDGGPVRFTAPVNGVPVLHRVAIDHRSLDPFGPDNATTADLAPDQLAAVTHDTGAARIIAPAGSGKTRVLTERARHLLQRWRLPAGSVCLVAFNKRAQEEMQARTSDLRGLQVRTLNAIALAIVNGSAPFARQANQLRTIDEGEVRRIIGDLVSFPRRRNADPVAPWIEAMSLARLGLRDPADVEAVYDGEVDGFAVVYPQYRAALARAGCLDFDEQIQRAIELLLREPATRAAAQRACQVLLVDEFQDLTPAHLLLVRLLAGADGAVFGVGDDDQTIYGYNGADPGWLIGFADVFPGAGDHPLEVNYRCPGGIVAAADMLLRHNRRRVPKVIRSAHPGEHGWTVRQDVEPVEATIETVRAALAAGRAPNEIAVLTRVNSLLAPVQVALVGERISTTGGVRAELLDRTSVRAALAWLRLASSGGRPLAPDDVTEALRRPARPLHPNVAKWVGEQTSTDGLRRLATRLTTERESERVIAFADDIERLRSVIDGGGTTERLMTTLRDSMGLAATVATLDVHRHGMNRASQNDDLTAIVELARLQPDPAAFEPWLRNALREPWDPSGITLATVHRVKGQEWPVVIVHHADADQFPHRLADDREEERRLFHVAITRASAAVTIVAGDQPSRFIAELVTEPSATPDPDERPIQRAAPAPATRPGDLLGGNDAALFEELRAVRRHLAAGKPAYTVVADATLAAIAAQRPTSLAALALIKGIGPSKLEQYGAALLAAVESATGPT